MTKDEEERLVAAARRGDSRAFAALTDAHQHAVRGFLRRYTGDWGDADDLAQEAFVTAWLKLDRFKGEASFRTWVTGIGYRAARDARRSRTRAAVRDLTWLEQQEREHVEGAPLEDRLALAKALTALPEDQRAAVALCLGEGFSHTEAAAALNMPVGTVKSHVARGRERLLNALEIKDE